MYDPTLEIYKEAGFNFEAQGGKVRLNDPNFQVVFDEVMQTTPNWGVPVELTAIINNETWEILTARRAAREIFNPRQRGSWVTPYEIWAVHEHTGKTGPYSDFANSPTAAPNFNWPRRQQYVFQTNIYYGIREQALYGEARIDWAAAKQRSAAYVIDRDWNKFALLGIDGMEIYGILNDPNLLPALTATAGWNTLDSTGVYNEYRELFRQLATQSGGLITTNSSLKLLVSPSTNVDLGASSNYSVPAIEQIRQFTPNVEIVVVPELEDAAVGGEVLLIASEVEGQRTADLGYSILYEASPVVPQGPTAYEQKIYSSTYGNIYYQEFAVARMTGVYQAA